jgi:hypothetical protein
MFAVLGTLIVVTILGALSALEVVHRWRHERGPSSR